MVIVNKDVGGKSPQTRTAVRVPSSFKDWAVGNNPKQGLRRDQLPQTKTTEDNFPKLRLEQG